MQIHTLSKTYEARSKVKKMLAELKENLRQEFEDLYPKTDWKEIIGSIAAGILLAVFAYLYFSIL